MANTSESPNFIAKHVEQSRVIADLQHQLAADGLEASWNTAVAAAVAVPWLGRRPSVAGNGYDRY